jgi:hypothetical protein
MHRKRKKSPFSTWPGILKGILAKKIILRIRRMRLTAKKARKKTYL